MAVSQFTDRLAAIPVPVARLIADVLRPRDVRALKSVIAERSFAAREDCLRLLSLLTALPSAGLKVVDAVAKEGSVSLVYRITAPALGGTDSTGEFDVTVLAVYRTASGYIVDCQHGWDEAAIRRHMGRDVPIEPLIELDQVQGNIFPGFNKDHLIVTELAMTDVGAARRGLYGLSGEVATAEEVSRLNRLFAELRGRRGHEGSLRSVWCNAALSFHALQSLTDQAHLFSDQAFTGGMANRTGRVESPAWESDLLLTVAGDVATDVVHETRRLVKLLSAGFKEVGAHRGASLAGREHFGFLDGVSQPGVRGRQPLPPFQPITSRANGGKPHEGKPGQELIWPGEFIVGYPGQGIGRNVGPSSIIGPRWARNGSLLVFAKYRQDVDAFDRYTRSMAARLAATYPSLRSLTFERLAALLVGRWRSGAPTLLTDERDIPSLGVDEHLNNDFLYRHASAVPSSDPYLAQADPDGIRCPFASHIRKVNPRDDVGDDGTDLVTSRHRMLRRGIPYGSPGNDDADRGLLFLSHQVSIERQFEFVLSRWVNNPHLRTHNEGFDPILGAGPGRHFGVRARSGTHADHFDIDLHGSWTTLITGGYYFTPSVDALRMLART